SVRRDVWMSVRTERNHLAKIKLVSKFLKHIFESDVDFLLGRPTGFLADGQALCGSTRARSLRVAQSAAIPDRPDRRPRPARAEAAAIVATAVKAGPAEIVPVAVVAVIIGDRIDIPGAPVLPRHAQDRSSLGVSRKAVVRWLPIARQETVA